MASYVVYGGRWSWLAGPSEDVKIASWAVVVSVGWHLQDLVVGGCGANLGVPLVCADYFLFDWGCCVERLQVFVCCAVVEPGSFPSALLILILWLFMWELHVEYLFQVFVVCL